MTGNSVVLVTGGAGYIGSHAVLALLDAGVRVVVIDNLSTGVRAAVPKEAVFVQGDIGDRELVARTISAEGVNAIMHFAGSIVVPESVTDPLKYYRNNTVKSQSLIELAVEHGVKRFIFSSTAAVYGTPEVLPIREDGPTQPINPYGASKLMTEWMLRDTAAAHDFRYVALRYFNVAGADMAGRAGQQTPGATHLIKVAAETVVGLRPELVVFGDDYPTPDGTCVRDYIHIGDLADAHLHALRHLEQGGDSLTANCGYGQGYSVKEVLVAVERAIGDKLPMRMGPRRAGDPAALVAANERIRAVLPWQPRYADLDVIVNSALDWERRLLASRSAAAE